MDSTAVLLLGIAITLATFALARFCQVRVASALVLGLLFGLLTTVVLQPTGSTTVISTSDLVYRIVAGGATIIVLLYLIDRILADHN